MTANSFEEILERAKNELSQEQQQQLSEVLLQLAGRLNGEKQYRITDLKGLGKEIWQGVDVDKYVEKERGSWDG